MSDRDLEYGHPDDDLSRLFTATLVDSSPSIQAVQYEPVNLTDDDPSHPFKVDATTFRLEWDFGAAKRVQFVLLVHHNFEPGLSGVMFAMGNSSATTDFSREFTIRDYHEDYFPVNEHLDLRDMDPTYRYASLEVTVPNTVFCSVGKFAMLETVRSLDGTLLIDAEDDEKHPLVRHATDVGVETTFVHGTRLRWLRGDKIVSAGDSAKIRAWNRASFGSGIPFVLIPHVVTDDELLLASPALSDNHEEAWIVRWEEDTLPRQYIGPDLLSRWRLKWMEKSRGLRPTPSAVP